MKLPTMAFRAVDGEKYLAFYTAARASGKGHKGAVTEAEKRIKKLKGWTNDTPQGNSRSEES